MHVQCLRAVRNIAKHEKPIAAEAEDGPVSESDRDESEAGKGKKKRAGGKEKPVNAMKKQKVQKKSK